MSCLRNTGIVNWNRELLSAPGMLLTYWVELVMKAQKSVTTFQAEPIDGLEFQALTRLVV
jgi:hypothetical protein